MIQQTLQEIGLSEKEAKVYIALLQQGKAQGPQDTANSTKLPRTTIYDVVSSLTEKGLIQEIDQSGKKMFMVDTPHHLFSFLDAKQMEVEKGRNKVKTVIRQLELMQNPNLPVPSLRHFEGEEGLLRMFRQQIVEVGGQDDSFTVVCTSSFFSTFQPMFRELAREVDPKGYTVRVLIASPEEDPVFIRMKNLEVKGTKEHFFFTAGIDVCGQFIGFWSEMDQLTGTLLEHQAMAKAQRFLFDIAWKGIPS